MPRRPIGSSAALAAVPFALATSLCTAALSARAQPAPAPASAASPASGPAGAGVAAVPGAAAVPPVQLDPVRITGNYDTSVGTTDAASAGTVTSRLIQRRPTLRPAEVLEFVPGVIVTQHSGDGKANQYFLRGFNLDHGTDFATYVDGMPVNMPTHAHGHGYTDLNWLIPELVDRLAYRKGPYYAEEGDFASAGSARIRLVDALPRGMALVSAGQDRHARALIANSHALGGGELLYAIEGAHDDGPWDVREKHRKRNGLLRWSFGNERERSSITFAGYSASWNATDQIPRRAVDSGLVGRFGTIDPSDGGKAERYSLSLATRRKLDDGEFRLDAYAIRSRLDLFSNFTFYLEQPSDLDPAAIDGDQFQQSERRDTVGLATRRSWNVRWGGVDVVNTVGLQIRHDRLDPVGLHATVRRQRAATPQESRIRQTHAGAYGESAWQWTPWFRSVAGLRVDRFRFDVDSSIAENSGERSAGIVTPKLSLVFGPWAGTETFLNYGHGFHSNDARGTTATVAAKTGEPVGRVTPVVRTRGAEIGVRTEIVPGLQSSLALWQLKIGSELLFVGDAGETEPTRPSRRRGVEWNNHYRAASWLLLDADLALSRARFSDGDPSGNRIPGAVDRVASLGMSVVDVGPWFGHFQLRHFGPRPLVEDNSRRSKATTLAYLRLGRRLGKDVSLALDVFNVFDRRASDIDYFYASRLRGEPAEGVEDIHFHPVEPRRFRISLIANF
ncbi:MAG TPA: TonB-dependent receptor [Caldimonas sp.]|jgi:outer membrane receptor protein involved in Fe transport|nr:TonB-dependent receptor [Caldimonas sp.]HEX2542778.1 TonB-dependent receptor [Caldimonas sp.]